MAHQRFVDEHSLYKLLGVIVTPEPCMRFEKTIGQPCAGNTHAWLERGLIRKASSYSWARFLRLTNDQLE